MEFKPGDKVTFIGNVKRHEASDNEDNLFVDFLKEHPNLTVKKIKKDGIVEVEETDFWKFYKNELVNVEELIYQTDKFNIAQLDYGVSDYFKDIIDNTINETVINCNEFTIRSTDKDFTKDDLKKLPLGSKITTNNGIELFKINNDRLENQEYFLRIDIDINDDLSLTREDEYRNILGTKIIKIEEPHYNCIYNNFKTISLKELIDVLEKKGIVVMD